MKKICRYCGQEKELCAAHIIPVSLYNVKKHRYVGLSSDGRIDLVHSQNGVKDTSILCAECDRILGEYDKYAANILKNTVLTKPLIPDEIAKEAQLYVLNSSSFDYNLLRKFFISLVWRASISKEIDISLGKYEDMALQILKGEIPDNPHLFHPIVFHLPKHGKFNDVAYITKGKYYNQWRIICSFLDYNVSIITNAEPIKNLRTVQMLSLNNNEFAVIESAEDITNTEQILGKVATNIKKKYGNNLPKFKI